MLGKTLAAGAAVVAAANLADVAPTPLARLLKAITANSADGVTRIACSDPEVMRVLKREGVKVDAEAPLAWAVTELEAKSYAQEGKLVLCANPAWVSAGAAVVVQVEGGRPVYTVYQEQVRRSGISVRSAVLHYAKERR